VINAVFESEGVGNASATQCTWGDLSREPVLSIVIPVDVLLYNTRSPCCPVETCQCHEDPELLAPVTQAANDGLLTSEEAVRLVMGSNVLAMTEREPIHGNHFLS